MSDWPTIASLCTAGGTLVLAVATFGSVRSANRAARAVERSLYAGLRPLLVPSRLEDPPEKVGFQDDHWMRVPGGRAIAEVTDEAIYLAMSLRNVGSGIAVLDRWWLFSEPVVGGTGHENADRFRRLTGGQRTISRFTLMPDSGDGWLVSQSRHWNLDRPEPR